MPPPNRMTANPARPTRYRPGKVTQAESSDSDSDASEEAQEKPAPPKTIPSASSFPIKETTQILNNLKNVDLNARRKAAAAAAGQKNETDINEEEFETESEEGSAASGSVSGEEESSAEEEEDESSSEDEVAARRKLMRPVFIRKDQRKDPNGGINGKTEDQRWAEEEEKRKARTNELVQDQLEKNAAARAAGKKFWDDEDNIADEVDDTDDLDPEAERAAWKLRELTRVKRERDALIAAEKEREEVERRRNLSKEEREAEDRVYLETQQQERDGKGKMAHLQKYHHKGAYYVEGLAEAGLDKRDIMGGRYADDIVNKDVLPEYMQIGDMTTLGKKGRTRYKDLKSEDTGRWGEFGDRRGKPGGGYSVDERFRPDYDGPGGGDGPSGANASALGERKRHADGQGGTEKRVRLN